MVTLHLYDNRHIKDQVCKISKGDTIVLVNSLSKKRWSLFFKYNSINEGELDINYITKKEFLNMKGTTDNKRFPFDVMLANPPYSSGDNLLYPPFFEKGLNLAETVYMIMPCDLESQGRVKNHNKLVKTHLIKLSENITDQFNVGIPDIRCVEASKRTHNEVDHTDRRLDAYTEIFPERARLFPRRGNSAYINKYNKDENGTPCISIIHRGKDGGPDKVIWTHVKPEIAQKVKAVMKSPAPWFVLVNENPSRGIFNTAIIRNDGTKWACGVFAFDADSAGDARQLEKWLKSATIQKEVQKLLSLKNTYSISGLMVSKLPRHR